MTVLLYILLAFAAIIMLVLLLDANLILKYETEFQAKIRICFITFDVMDLFNGKNRTKTISKSRKKISKTETARDRKKKGTFEDFIGFIDLVGSIIQMLSENLSAKLKINLKKLIATIGSSEADKTAYMYGAVCNAVSVMLDLITNFVRKFKRNDNNIIIKPDYTSEKCVFQSEMIVTLKVWHLIVITLKTMGILNKNVTDRINRKGK